MNAEDVVNEIQGGHGFVHPASKVAVYARVATVVEAAVATPPKEKVHVPKTFLIRSQVKRYALDVSKRKRAGKFTRMSEAFFVSCEAEMEGKVRSLQLHDTEPVTGMFITGHCVNAAKEKLNQVAKAIVHGKVMRHPSISVTLMGG